MRLLTLTALTSIASAAPRPFDLVPLLLRGRDSKAPISWNGASLNTNTTTNGSRSLEARDQEPSGAVTVTVYGGPSPTPTPDNTTPTPTITITAVSESATSTAEAVSTAAASEPTATGGALPYYLQFHYSNHFVKVGNTNIFSAIWQKGFDRADETGIEADDTYKSYGYKEVCVWKEGAQADLEVNVKLSGAWGKVSGVDGYTVRTQLIQAMWEITQKIWEEADTIWTDCVDCGLGGCSDNVNATCGAWRPEMCGCYKHQGGGGEAMALCFGREQAYNIPSEMTLSLYNADGSLRADSLTVTVESKEIEAKGMHCGKLGAVAEVVVGIIPDFGKYISDQIKIMCRT